MSHSTRNAKTACPICDTEVDSLIRDLNVEGNSRILAKIREKHPHWSAEKGICSRCFDASRVEILEEDRLVPAADSNLAVVSVGDYKIPPTPLRMNVDPVFTGKGVTICFIDSGFYLHPDLVKPNDRILRIHDITAPKRKKSYFFRAHAESWHGTMTSVVCAGNGHLSAGMYKGIACDANLVLLKVQNDQGISGDNITKAIRWAIANRKKYNIRIINLSVSDDWPDSYKDSEVDQAAEEAIAAGIIVVAAVGNDSDAAVKPPANSPNVISVGGLNDHNTPDPHDDSMYHSTYGTTVDNFLKPDVIAPAIWIAAPILPDTPDHIESGTLHELSYDENLSREKLAEKISKTKLDSSLLSESSVDSIKEQIKHRITQAKYISPHYMHADGTSFAAPIICSLIAQMLEANPDLTPAFVREILLSSAQPLPNVEIERQGYGMVNARSCVEKAKVETHNFLPERSHSPRIDVKKQNIAFFYHNHDAQTVMLIGDFTGWSQRGFLFKAEKAGRWSCKLPMLPAGEYRYKLVIDDSDWISDPRNPFTEADGYNGLNSKFVIERLIIDSGG